MEWDEHANREELSAARETSEGAGGEISGEAPPSGELAPLSRAAILVPSDKVLEAAPDAMVVVDPNGTITYVNGEAEKLFGYSRSELVGKAIEALIPAAQRRHHVASRTSFTSSPHPRPMGQALSITGQRKDGTVFPADVKLSPLRTPAGLLVTAAVRDISERKRHEEQLRTYADHLERLQASLERKNIELGQRNEELEQFAYVSSHDLQEPLRKIIAFGDRLKARCEGSLDEKSLDYLERIHSASSRMQALISDLLEFSRLSTRGRPFQRVDLHEAATSALSDLEVAIELSGGRVEVGRLPSLDGDAGQLRQLLLNLIGNALKFRREGVPPVVKVSGRAIPAEELEPGAPPMIEISVEDNGIGIEPRFLNRIFTVFERLHPRGRYQGTGIGLAICKKIAERHGGTIKVMSELGRGSTFIVTLPKSHAERGH